MHRPSSTLPSVSISFLASFLWLKCTLAPENSGAMGPLRAWRLAIRSWDTVLWFVFGLKEVVVASEGIIHFNKIVSFSRDIRNLYKQTNEREKLLCLKYKCLCKDNSRIQTSWKNEVPLDRFYTQANINKHTCTHANSHPEFHLPGILMKDQPCLCCRAMTPPGLWGRKALERWAQAKASSGEPYRKHCLAMRLPPSRINLHSYSALRSAQ